MRNIFIMVVVFILTTVASLSARTVTEGTLDIREIVSEVTADLKDFQTRKSQLVQEIDDSKKAMEKLSRAYERARTEKDRYRFKAESLDQASQLVDAYTQVLVLTEEKAKSIIPNLEKIRRAVNEGPIGRQARDLNNPQFRQHIRNFYGNMATLALTSKDPELKRDVARFLKETEMLYQPRADHSKEFNNLLKNLDIITERFSAAYAQAALRKKILVQKKERLQIAIEMVRYSLALNTIQKGLDSINPEDFQKIPEVDFNVDGLIEPGGGGATQRYSDPQVDQVLMGYQNGPRNWR